MRRRMLMLLIAVVAVFATSMVVQAEPVSPYFYVGPAGGYTFFRDSLVLKDNFYVGGKLGYQWLPWLGLEAVGGYTPTQVDVPAESDITFWHASGNLVFSPWGTQPVVPYVFVGGGYSSLKLKDADDDMHFGTGEFGAGVRYWFNDMLGFQVEGRGILSLPKESWCGGLRAGRDGGECRYHAGLRRQAP